MYKTKEVSAPN